MIMRFDLLSFDNAALIGPKERYNPAMIRHRGETLLVYRTGMCYEGRLFFGRLDAGYRPAPRSFRELPICVPAYQSFEDPRFFHYRDGLFLYFTGFNQEPFRVDPFIGAFDPAAGLRVVKALRYPRQALNGEELGVFRLRRPLTRTYWVALTLP
jgi:hypothetical protein